MDDIFQSVIGVSEDEDNENSNKPKPMAKVNSGSSLPVYLNLGNHQTTLNNNNNANNVNQYADQLKFFPTFDDESLSHDTFLIQENSHLIQFDCCLIGCIFYIQINEAYYSADCANDWRRVIERFGGKHVSEYFSHSEEITHVICSNRFSDIYKKAVEDKKRVVTPYWLEDVLQEQKLRAPWLAYHFPSPFVIKEGPLTNYVSNL